MKKKNTPKNTLKKRACSAALASMMLLSGLTGCGADSGQTPDQPPLCRQQYRGIRRAAEHSFQCAGAGSQPEHLHDETGYPRHHHRGIVRRGIPQNAGIDGK